MRVTPNFALLRILPPTRSLVPPDGVLGPDEHKKVGTGSVMAAASFRPITDPTRLSVFSKHNICALFSKMEACMHAACRAVPAKGTYNYAPGDN